VKSDVVFLRLPYTSWPILSRAGMVANRETRAWRRPSEGPWAQAGCRSELRWSKPRRERARVTVWLNVTSTTIRVETCGTLS